MSFCRSTTHCTEIVILHNILINFGGFSDLLGHTAFCCGLWVRKTSHATHTHIYKNLISEITGYGVPFVAVISKKGLITFQHSSLKQPIAFQIFVTKWPITVKHSSQPLYHLFFTALYESTPCWLTESTLVNQQGWSSESLRLNDQQGWIIWSDSPTTETPGGSLKPKEDRQKRESNKKEEKTKNAEVGRAHLLKRRGN